MQDELKLLRRFSLSAAATIALLCLAVTSVQTVHAATLTVTSTADSGAGSLRQALADAIDGDTIQFASALNGQIIGFTSAELVIDKNITITGPGPDQLTVQRSTATGTPKFRIFHILPGHVVQIAGLTISGGSLPATDTGGGVHNDQSALTLNNCAVFSCAAGSYGTGGTGGGIYNNNGTLEINDSSISGNFADALCGGIYNTAGGTLRIRDSIVSGNGVTVQFSNPPQVVGSVGGILNAGTAEVTNCTIDRNNGGGGGGGISNTGSLTIANSTISKNTVLFSGGGIGNSGPLTISNSTISGNAASFKGFGDGGGISTSGGAATVTISNSTISGNFAPTTYGHGGGIYVAGGTLDLENTILKAGAAGANIFNNSGTVMSHGYNLSSDDGSGFLTAPGDQINTDPMLGPLQNNGGPTLTHVLSADSPAIDAGNPNFAPPPLYDQRGPGHDRVVNGRIDIGSFEVRERTIVVTTSADDGPGSLRAALAAAGDGDLIQFTTGVVLTSSELVIDKSVAISGPGPNQLGVQRSSANGTPEFRIFRVTPGHVVTIEYLTIRRGLAQTGAGVFADHATLTINNCIFDSNVAREKGGGLYNDGDGSTPVVLVDTTFRFNQATGGVSGGIGGAIYNTGTLEIKTGWLDRNKSGAAAAIANHGTMSVSDSNIVENVQVLPFMIDSSAFSGQGSGCGCGAGISNSNLLTISNSTVSSNSGGIDNQAGATLEIRHSTVSSQGSIHNVGATLRVENTILNASSGSDNISSPPGTVVSQGYNLCSDDCRGLLTGMGDLSSTDPMLGPLTYNGGQTRTHALLLGSPAIDAGNPSFTPPPDFDQRGPGYPRVANGRINIGSLEMQPQAPTPTPTPTATPTATATPPATPTPSPTAPPSPTPAQALNISTRLRVETGDRVMIGGFIITGNEPKKVAIRGIGPSLGNSGLTDFLADPTLELRGSAGALLVQNDNWQDDSEQAAQLMALGLAPQHPNESGMVATLQPGAYTAIVAGKNQTSGIGLVEIYDADAAAASQLANISTRGFVQPGDNVMIGGFILDNGDASTAVAVRGVGPSLTQSGLSNVLADPTLELRDGNGALLIANDNWQDDSASATQLSANGLAPQNPLESGIFTTLPPGLFSAVLAGKDGGIGLGLVEVYGNLHPSTLVVTNTIDGEAGSLRQVLTDANNGDTIQFDASLYGRAIILRIGLVIDKDIVISGFGPNHSSIERVDSLMLSVLEIASGHTVLLEGLTIRGGRARVSGGGIRNGGSTLILNNCAVESNTSDGSGAGISHAGPNLTIVNSVVRHNSITGALNPIGGGIYGSGTMEIRNSKISGNVVMNGTTGPGAGGGIGNVGTMTIFNSTVSENSASVGAGIASFGPLAITNSTISGNIAFNGVQGVGNGGGGISSNSGPLTITNSTISENSAAGGGGIVNGGQLTITHTTISDNQTDPGSGTIDNSGSLEIGNTILKTGPSGVNIVNNSGTVVSHGYNLSSDNGAGFLAASGDQVNTDPLLGPLQDNGGSTFTHELLTGSPAINAGNPDFVSPPFFDQRGNGHDRVVNGRIDIGSFEVQPSPTPTPTPGLRR
jgi:hypothetical protein